MNIPFLKMLQTRSLNLKNSYLEHLSESFNFAGSLKHKTAALKVCKSVLHLI